MIFDGAKWISNGVREYVGTQESVQSNPEAGAQLCSLLISALSTTDLLSHYESDPPHGEALYSIV